MLGSSGVVKLSHGDNGSYVLTVVRRFWGVMDAA
jgi:hypothetical protein